jgi:ribonucleoside-diphosphate reductase alpha chain
MLRDDFMEAVKKDEDYILRFPCDSEVDLEDSEHLEHREYNALYDFREAKIKKIKAKELYDAIVENAWENAEPGQIFIDKHWERSPDGVYPQYRGVTTNPCGEIFMQPYDACRLMALNLFSFVNDPFTDKASLDLQMLERMAYMQQRLADDLVDLELEHILRILSKLRRDPEAETIKKTEIELWEKIYEVASSGRRTGCGFTGLGDMLAALGLKYDSEEAMKTIDLVMKTKMSGELKCTTDLAILRGTFDGWDKTLEFEEDSPTQLSGKNQFFKMLEAEFGPEAVRMNRFGRRNVSWSTVAPTGSVSLLTQTTSGLEPLFAPYFTRRKKVNPGDDVRVDFTDQNGDNWMEYPVIHPPLKKWLEDKYGGPMPDNPHSEAIERGFKTSPWYGSCAPDIDWKSRVEIQGIIQKYTTHSISSTINLPNEVTQEEVAEIYLHAFDKAL